MLFSRLPQVFLKTTTPAKFGLECELERFMILIIINNISNNSNNNNYNNNNSNNSNNDSNIDNDNLLWVLFHW
jgi:hypothetical protein